MNVLTPALDRIGLEAKRCATREGHIEEGQRIVNAVLDGIRRLGSWEAWKPIGTEARTVDVHNEFQQFVGGDLAAPLERLLLMADRLPAQGERDENDDDPRPDRKEGVPRDEAEVRVRDWLKKHAKDDPASVTRDAVAAGTGVSTGLVSNTAAWKAFRDRRDAEKKPGERKVQYSDQMDAVLSAGTVGKAESEQRNAQLNALIRDQAAEAEEDEIRSRPRPRRRHEPS
jgi:hypothetical protein